MCNLTVSCDQAPAWHECQGCAQPLPADAQVAWLPETEPAVDLCLAPLTQLLPLGQGGPLGVPTKVMRTITNEAYIQLKKGGSVL